MQRPTARHLVIDSEAILEALTQRQFLQPHSPLNEALPQVADELRLCPEAVAQALAWLEVDATRVIGRLRRSELSQLAKSIHRIWRHAAATASASQ